MSLPRCPFVRFWLAALLGTPGCKAAAPAADGFVATDSSGVTITDSKVPQWTAGQAWTVDSVPLLDIGSADGDEPYLLNGAESAWRTKDRGIVFANTGTQELRFFDSTGRFVKAVGRRGGGPGEFGQFSFMMITPTPSELLVADEMNNRVNVYDPAGSFRRTVQFAIGSGRAQPSLLGVVGADWLVKTYASSPESDAKAWQRDTIRFQRYRPDGTFQAAITSVPTQPYWRFGVRDRWMTMRSVPMTAEPSAWVDTSGLIVRTADAEIERWSVDGKLVSRYRWAAANRRRVADVADQYRKHWLSTSDSAGRKMVDALYQSNPILPDWVATHSRIAAGPDGTLWVQHFYLDWEPARRWDVLDRRGRWLGTVAMPARHWLYRVADDQVLAWHRDSLDVEHVTVHRLRRPPGPR